jgi:hypothetical protein
LGRAVTASAPAGFLDRPGRGRERGLRLTMTMFQLSREHADNPLLKKVISAACIIGIERSNRISYPID